MGLKAGLKMSLLSGRWVAADNGYRGFVLLLLLVTFAACDGSGSSPAAEHASGGAAAEADHDAEMAQDAEAALQRSLAAAADKPPVLDAEEVIRRTGVDSTTATPLTARVAALNAALVRLVELHRSRDAAEGSDAQRQIDVDAYAIHLEADRYEDDIHRLLNEEQHRRFHAYLVERAAAVGLPLDESHGAAGVGTMGSIGTVGHPAGGGHAVVPPVGEVPHAHAADAPPHANGRNASSERTPNTVP